nr:DUF512 domain-containing protein [uncultured Gemmiger sp.]
MPLVVQSVDENSLAQRLGLNTGCLLLAIDGNPLCDALDYQFYTASKHFTLTVCEDGTQRDISVEKDEYEPLGCNFKTYLADEKHSCDNHCMFCFIDQLPPGMRAPLYFKDDDERLSFLYGNYITMTNLSEREVERIVKMHISPIFISVHTTNPALRVRMMANKKAADTLKYLDVFAKGGIEMNCQLVLCRGINDGDELRHTLDDLLALRPHVGSIAAVPAGVTDYRDKLFKLTPYDAKTAGETLDILEEYSRRCREQYGRSIVYPSDEWYLTAGREIPPTEFYDDFAQLEDGVGMWRQYYDTFLQELSKPRRLVLPRHFDVATGTLAAPLIEQMAQETQRRYPGVHITVHAIENRFFGGNVSVAGLVTATDIIDQCRGKLSSHILAVPAVMLQDEEDRFLDDITPEQLGEALGCRVVVIPTDGAGSCRAYLGVRMLKAAPHKPKEE